MDVVLRPRGVSFIWDRRKKQSNLRRQGIAFETAYEAFLDPFVRLIETAAVSGEEREAAVGMTSDWRLLRVVYGFRSEAVCIISARPITLKERMNYEEQ